MSGTVVAIRESVAGERRIALTPEIAKKLRSAAVQVVLEKDAGNAAFFPDGSFADVSIVATAAEALSKADVLLKVQPPSQEEIAQLREGSIVIGYLQPHASAERVKALRDRKITAFSMELLPRTTRAQAMDVLSSQAGMAGYKAVLIAAEVSGKFFPMLTTAAGTIRPSKVLIVGAGVAGLQAIATARRLGAQVEGFDVRPETKEQIESLGAKFLDLGVSAAGSGGYARELTAEERAEQQAQTGRTSERHRCDRDHGGRAWAQGPAHHQRCDGRRHEAGQRDRRSCRRNRRQLRADRRRAKPWSDQQRRQCGRSGQSASMGCIHASEMYARNLLQLPQPDAQGWRE
jgi:NAD/NADP transhydrogenase alpha subunit